MMVIAVVDDGDCSCCVDSCCVGGEGNGGCCVFGDTNGSVEGFD